MLELSSQISSILLLGFLLGLKHATDADHVVAVTAILSSSNNLWKSIWVGISWGAGHSIPLIALGLIILFVKESFINHYQNIAIVPNCKYVSILVENKPKIFLIVTNNINIGDEILADYKFSI